MPVAVMDGSAVRYLHTDQLDTPREVSDTSGNVVWQWDNSDPFGNNVANENPGGAGTFSFPLRFPGQYFDQETQTHYNVNRDYDPAIGRYIQSDPIGLAGGVNTYGYVGGNPLSYIDSLGLKTTILIGGDHWYGHAALMLNGTVYSNGRYKTGIPAIDGERSSYIAGQALEGPNVLIIESANEYLSKSTVVKKIEIDLTPEQEQAIKSFYENEISNAKPIPGQSGRYRLPSDYAFIGNNCADNTAKALKAGLPWYKSIFISGILTSPAQLETELSISPGITK